MPRPLKPYAFLLAALALAALAHPAAGQDAGGSGKLVVTADENLEWRRQDQRYVATGNATASQGDTTLLAGRIEASYRDTDGDIALTRVEGIGGAELRKARITARAGRIDYDLLADRAVLTGADPTITTDGESITAAERIDYDREKREVRAEGRVVVVLGEGRILKASSIHAKVNDAEDDFTFVHAMGDAEVSAPGPAGDHRRATADEIEYTQGEDLVVLTGSVEIFDGANSVTGDRAEIDLASGVSNITSRSGRVGGVFSTVR